MRCENILRTFPGFPRTDAARLPAGKTKPVGLALADVGENIGTAVVAVAPFFLKEAEPTAQASVVEPVHHIGAVGIGRGLVEVPAGVDRPEGGVVAALAALRERRHRTPGHRQLGGFRHAERAQAKEIGKENLRERLLEFVLDPAAQQHRPAVWAAVSVTRAQAEPGGRPTWVRLGESSRPGNRQPLSAFLDDSARKAGRQPHGHIAGEGKGKIKEPGRLGFGGENFADLRVAKRDDAAVVLVDADLQSIECFLPRRGMTANKQRPQQRWDQRALKKPATNLASWHEEAHAVNSFTFYGEGISDLWHAIQTREPSGSGQFGLLRFRCELGSSLRLKTSVKHFYNTTGLNVCESETVQAEWLTGLRRLTCS